MLSKGVVFHNAQGRMPMRINMQRTQHIAASQIRRRKERAAQCSRHVHAERGAHPQCQFAAPLQPLLARSSLAFALCCSAAAAAINRFVCLSPQGLGSLQQLGAGIRASAGMQREAPRTAASCRSATV